MTSFSSTSIEQLDLSLFSRVPSQTTDDDRRTLLAVQRAVTRAHSQYAYLEIGSYLGGTIQPYLADPHCVKIYSVDPRPPQNPDDRSPGYIVHNPIDSSQRMLRHLDEAELGDIGKIECIELDASQIDPSRINPAPQIIFIDGEHTKRAVISDFRFSSSVIAEDGVIVFHDFGIVHEAIAEICNELRNQGCDCTPVKLEGDVFAIFYGRTLLASDEYLYALYKQTKRFMLVHRIKLATKRVLPNTMITVLGKVADCFRSNI